MPLDFLMPERKKKKRKEKNKKLIWKKIQKHFIVNNNNKIICVWYLSSKWPVCRSIVNQTTGGISRTKLSTLLNTNIFKYCVLFCSKVAKIYLQERNSYNSNDVQMHFCPFSELFPFLLESKISEFYCFYFVSTIQLLLMI